MAYSYKYIPASMSGSPKKGAEPKSDYIELFQQTLDEQFYNASNWWTVEEETVLGSEEFNNIDVRISHVINAETGLKLGDDWKTLFFREVDHNIELGRLYKFDNSTWLTTNTEYIKNLTGTCTIRRCNNTLRWINQDTGKYYEEPCVIDYLVKEPRNYATQGSPFMTPGGFLHIEVQLNDRTNLIEPNLRFLFGNENHWAGYKVIGTGINNFRNNKTYDNGSSKVLTLDLIADYVNEQLDDTINGIADVETNVYTIELNEESIQGSPGETLQLYTSVTYNGKTVSRDVTWSSSASSVASINTSGLVTFNSNGSCVITVSLDDNPEEDTCDVTVTDTPQDNRAILILPDQNYVLEGTSQSYSAYLYVNGVQQPDNLTFTCDPNDVPEDNYTFNAVNGHNFIITNVKKYVESYLTITCTTGTDTKDINIRLKGAW